MATTGFALLGPPPPKGKAKVKRGRGRRVRDPKPVQGQTREARCLPELLGRLGLRKYAQTLRHIDYAAAKQMEPEDLEELGLDRDAAARLAGASRREVGELLFYKPQGFGFIRPLGETDRKKNIMAHRSAFSHPSVPLRLPESALVAYSLGIHKKSTVAREVRPLDALEAPAPEARDSPPTVPIVTPPASPQKQEPADAKAHASVPAAPRLEPAGPYGYGEFREDANTDPVFTPVSAPSTHFSPSPRDPRASSGRKNSLGTIVAPIGTPSAPSLLLAPPPPEAPGVIRAAAPTGAAGERRGMPLLPAAGPRHGAGALRPHPLRHVRGGARQKRRLRRRVPRLPRARAQRHAHIPVT